MNKRIETLILLLGSNHSGEAANAAAALVKELAKTGKDLHWLKDRANGAAPEPPRQIRNRPHLLRAQAEPLDLDRWGP